jgi:hypothetical protein
VTVAECLEFWWQVPEFRLGAYLLGGLTVAVWVTGAVERLAKSR